MSDTGVFEEDLAALDSRVSVFECFSHQARRYSDRVAIARGDECYTYAELDLLCARVANAIADIAPRTAR